MLYPLGHPASLIKITERRIDRSKGAPIAYLFQHMYIVVRQPLMEYGAPADFPYSSVRLTTLVTPQLQPPEKSAIFPNRLIFWPTLGNATRFQFRGVGLDASGKESHFDTPLIFIEDGSLGTTSPLSAPDPKLSVQKAFQDAFGSDASPKDPDLSGQAIAFAPAQVPGDTTFETRSMGFDAGIRWIEFPAFHAPGVRVRSVDQEFDRQERSSFGAIL